jgi:hypothetical protein
MCIFETLFSCQCPFNFILFADDLQSADSERLLPGVHAERQRHHVRASVHTAVRARHLHCARHLHVQEWIWRLRLLKM